LGRRERAYKNVLSLQLSRVLTKIFQVFFLAVAARYLGTDGFGQWSLVFLLIGFFGLLADFGVDRWTVRDVARDLSRSKQYLSNTLFFKCFSLIPATVLLLTVLHLVHYPEETVELLYLALPLLFIGALTNPFSSIIQAHEKIYLLSMVDIAQGLATSIVGITLLFLGFGIRGLLIMSIVSSLLRCVALALITRRMIGSMFERFQPAFLRFLTRQSLPFAVLNILALIHWKIDYIMISKLLGTAELGLFAASWKIVENIGMMGMALNTALYPSVSALFVESKTRLRKVYEGLQKCFVIVSLPIAIIIFFFSEEIILLMYGEQYVESIDVLVIMSFGFSIVFFSIPMRLIINNSNLIMKLVPYSILTTALNVLLNFLAIPRYGIIGAAFVTLLAAMIDVLIRILLIRRVFHEGYHPLQIVWKPLVGAILMISIIVLFSGVNKFVFTVVGLVAYVYSLRVMGTLSHDEYQRFFREPLGRLISSLVTR
jgi:O-antigen/teichoic acid export membrane protein